MGLKGDFFLDSLKGGVLLSNLRIFFYRNGYSSQSDFIYPCFQMIFVLIIISSLLWSSQLIPTKRRVEQCTNIQTKVARKSKTIFRHLCASHCLLTNITHWLMLERLGFCDITSTIEDDHFFLQGSLLTNRQQRCFFWWTSFENFI